MEDAPNRRGGSRGIGKNTMLLLHIKLHHKPDDSVLYASADNIEYGSGNYISLRMFGFPYSTYNYLWQLGQTPLITYSDSSTWKPCGTGTGGMGTSVRQKVLWQTVQVKWMWP